jgi:hypothetical protein
MLSIEPCGVYELARARGGRCLFELYQPGGRELHAFMLDGARVEPFERWGAARDPPPLPALPLGVRYRGRVVFPARPQALMLRMYVETPVDRDTPALIWQHVGQALLRAGQPAADVFAHSDNGWCSPPEVHARAALSGPADRPVRREGYVHASGHDAAAVTPLLECVFDKVIWPDMAWLYGVGRRHMHPNIRKFCTVPCYNAGMGLPIYAADYAARVQNPGMFPRCSGVTGQAMWYADRGRGPMAEDAYLEQRLREALALRGRRRREDWLADFGAPYPASREEEFAAVVERCLLAADPVKPGGGHRGSGLLHNWAREATEDVIRALGAHAATRRYVFDHRWQRVAGEWVYNDQTDDNTLSSVVPGDCEDSNSLAYFMALQMMQAAYAPGSLLHHARACLLVAGVPVCTAGSSEPPSTQGDSPGSVGSHLYGFFVPFRRFARLVWGEAVSDAAVRAELARALGRPVSEYVYRAAMPMFMESITFVTPDYLALGSAPGAWRRDGHRARYLAYMRYVHAQGASLVFPDAFGVECPLGLPAPGGVRFVVHERAIRLFTAAVPLLFSPAFRRAQPAPLTVNAAMQAEGDPLAAPGAGDAALDRTMSFVAMSCVADPAERCKNVPGPLNNLGVRCDALHDDAQPFRLVCTTMPPQDAFDADRALMQYERPFVPLAPFSLALLASTYEQELARRGMRAEPEPPTDEFHRFTLYVYDDRLQQAAPHMARLYALLGAKGFCVRPWCFCLAIVMRV